MNTPKLKIGDTFKAPKGGFSGPSHLGTCQHANYNVVIDKIGTCEGGKCYQTTSDCHFPVYLVDPFLSSNKSPVKQPETWTQKTEYISKSGFKIEKDKITFPDGKTYTFDEFTKHYNQLRSVYRKLSDLKKLNIF